MVGESYEKCGAHVTDTCAIHRIRSQATLRVPWERIQEGGGEVKYGQEGVTVDRHDVNGVCSDRRDAEPDDWKRFVANLQKNFSMSHTVQ